VAPPPELKLGGGDPVLPQQVEDSRVMPEAVIPEPPRRRDPVPVAAITHEPLGLGAAQFGLFTFALLVSVTLSALMLFRQPLVRAHPPMLAAYRLLHIGVTAPGEGLRLSAMTAESHVEGAKRSLRVEARLANISDHETPFPSLRLRLRDVDGALLKEWSLGDVRGGAAADDKPSSGGKPLLSGADLPLKLNFDNPPAGGKTAELTVAGN
jgi:hypothetical protein